MVDDKRHVEFDINYIEGNKIKIETDGCSVVTEYFEDNSATRTTMSPANLMFAAFALCASMDVLAFCQQRQLSTEGFKIRQIVDWDKNHTDHSKVILKIDLPVHFPKKYHKAVEKVVDSCLVAKLGKDLSANSFETVINQQCD